MKRTESTVAKGRISGEQKEMLKVLSEGKTLKDVLDLTEEDLNALMFAGYELFNQGNYDDSQVIFKGLEALGHSDPFISTALGTLAAREDDLETAETYFNNAIETDPEDVVALTNRAELYLKRNQFQQAAEDLQRAIELDAEESSALGSRARVLAMVTHELMESIQKTA